LGERLFKVNYEARWWRSMRPAGALGNQGRRLSQGFSATAAPLVVKNQVIVGIAGASSVCAVSWIPGCHHR
jgi:hypothetical protein